MSQVQYRTPGAVTLTGQFAGPTTGQPVILLHGAGRTRNSWDETVAELVHRGFRTLAIDLRGHGESEWAPNGDYSMDALADDVRAIVDQLDQQVVLVGASMGGLAALSAAGEEPPVDCAALILVDVTPRISTSGSQKIVDFMRRGIEGWASLEDAAQAISRFLPPRRKSGRSEGLLRSLRRYDDGCWRWHWDPALLDPGRLQLTRGTPERYESAAGKLSCPALLIRGSSSELVGENDVQEFLRIVPHAEYVAIAEATHAVADGRDRMVARSVGEFVSRVTVPDRPESLK